MQTTETNPIAWYIEGDLDLDQPWMRTATVLHADGSETRVTWDRSSGEPAPLPSLPCEVRYDRPGGAYLVSDDPRHILAGRALDDVAARSLRGRLAAMRAAA